MSPRGDSVYFDNRCPSICLCLTNERQTFSTTPTVTRRTHWIAPRMLHQGTWISTRSRRRQHGCTRRTTSKPRVLCAILTYILMSINDANWQSSTRPSTTRRSSFLSCMKSFSANKNHGFGVHTKLLILVLNKALLSFLSACLSTGHSSNIFKIT